MHSIDLNCDMGESFGVWKTGSDAELMDYVSSVNLACGFHAGDPTTIRKTVETALEKGLAIGAHPGYPDLQGFGRRDMSFSGEETRDLVLYQVAAMKGICEARGGTLSHVKPHGALYNKAARDPVLASSIVDAVKDIDKNLILFGLSGSFLISEAEAAGLQTASEVFADRTYSDDGTLTPRDRSNALITDINASVLQVLQMIESQTVTATSGRPIPVRADTICIHGDRPNATSFARAINEAICRRNIGIRPIKT